MNVFEENSYNFSLDADYTEIMSYAIYILGYDEDEVERMSNRELDEIWTGVLVRKGIL